MCRLLAYVGPPVPLARLLLLGEPSLLEQSYRPRQMTEALLNADGFGVAWYTAVDPAPARYRSALPMWNDENVPSIAPHIASGRVLAALRSATPGVGFGLMNTPPFVNGRYAFAHNGLLEGFADGVGRRLREGLGERAYRAILGSSDSEHLFAVFLDELRRRDAAEDETARLAGALEATIVRAEALRREVAPDACSYLNLVVCDGERAAVTRYATGKTRPTSLHFSKGRVYVCERGLCHMVGEGEAHTAVLIASEPLEDNEVWQTVEPHHMVVVTPALEVTTRPLALA